MTGYTGKFRLRTATVYLSGKITNAVLVCLSSGGEDITRLYSFPLERLQDPSAWIPAPEVEEFLEEVQRFFPQPVDLLRQAGHQGHKLRPWGVLDSVLRMMPRPQEVFQRQPERFLSYFISPEPPIENLSFSEHKVAFDLPLPAEQYPRVSAYLKAAFEGIPQYAGGAPGLCRWEGIHICIEWPQLQPTLFAKDPGHQLSRDLLDSVISDYHRMQSELDSKVRELQNKEEEIRRLRKDLEALKTSSAKLSQAEALDIEKDLDVEDPYRAITHNFARLHDYMVRAQQLITILAGLTKGSAALREGLKRTDWEFVKAEYPRTLADSLEMVRRLRARQLSTSPVTKRNSPPASQQEEMNV